MLHEYCWHLLHTTIYGKELVQPEISYITSGYLLIALRPLVETPNHIKASKTPGNCTLDLHGSSPGFSLDGVTFTSKECVKLCHTSMSLRSILWSWPQTRAWPNCQAPHNNQNLIQSTFLLVSKQEGKDSGCTERGQVHFELWWNVSNLWPEYKLRATSDLPVGTSVIL
jgi:hypothetical protein